MYFLFKKTEDGWNGEIKLLHSNGASLNWKQLYTVIASITADERSLAIGWHGNAVSNGMFTISNRLQLLWGHCREDLWAVCNGMPAITGIFLLKIGVFQLCLKRRLILLISNMANTRKLLHQTHFTPMQLLHQKETNLCTTRLCITWSLVHWCWYTFFSGEKTCRSSVSAHFPPTPAACGIWATWLELSWVC